MLWTGQEPPLESLEESGGNSPGVGPYQEHSGKGLVLATSTCQRWLGLGTSAPGGLLTLPNLSHSLRDAPLLLITASLFLASQARSPGSTSEPSSLGRGVMEGRAGPASHRALPWQ